MTDRAQFEAMLEALINEDQETAKEIFHNIVVGKSREIYEELLAEDFSPEEANKNAGLGGHQSENMEE
jgi:riboflavin synthase